MRTLVLTFLLGALVCTTASGQARYVTRNGEVTFFSATPMENIQAVNHKATSVLDVSSGAVEFAVLMKAFEFEKALMQEHFNENYMESGTYPKGMFKGKVVGLSPSDATKPGAYDVTLEGDLTMHGVTQHVSEKGKVTVEADGKLKASCDLIIKPENYKITIPTVVRGQIAEEIQVKVRIDYQKM